MALRANADQAGASETSERPLPRLCLRLLSARILRQSLLLLLLVEAIFIAEKLNETILTVLDRSAPTFLIPIFVGLRLPDVFNLALPIALVIATYRVLLQAREDREMLILSGMGISADRVLRVAWTAGAIALATSFLVSGLIAPAAQFAQRYLLFEARFAALRDGGAPGIFYTFAEFTVFVTRGDTQDRQLFIHQRKKNSADTESVTTASSGELVGLDGEGTLALRLTNATIVNFAAPLDAAGTDSLGQEITCPTCSLLPRSVPTRLMHTRSVDAAVDPQLLTEFPARGRHIVEAGLFDLLAGPTSLYSDTARAIELGRRLGRALLCLIVPLIACVAVVLTTARTRAVALPVAAASVLALDLAMSSLVELGGGLGILPLAALLTALVVALAAAAALHVRRAEVAMIMPALVRA